MNGRCAKPRSGVLTGFLALALLALAACNGTAVVTMTSTASQDSFLAYRVELVSVALQSSGGKSGLSILPAGTTVDFAALTNLSEVLGAAAAAKGSYQSVLVTLDYSAAQIVYDDGSRRRRRPDSGRDGRPGCGPHPAYGQARSERSVQPLLQGGVAARVGSQSGRVQYRQFERQDGDGQSDDCRERAAHRQQAVRIRGPIVGTTAGSAATATSTEFTMGVMPFNGTVAGTGKLAIVTTDGTDFEVNGNESTGTVGLGAAHERGRERHGGGLWHTDRHRPVDYHDHLHACEHHEFRGTTSTTNPDGTPITTNPDGTPITTTPIGTPSTTIRAGLTFTATQVLAGSSVQGGGLDRVTGIVSARSGNTLTVEDGTLVANDGTETFLGGTTFVLLGPNTLVTVFGQSTAEINSPQQISVGSSIDAFGIATSLSLNNATLDASAGRVRLDTTTASGLVVAQGAGALGLNLVSLDGRSIAPFDFAGAGIDPRGYSVTDHRHIEPDECDRRCAGDRDGVAELLRRSRRRISRLRRCSTRPRSTRTGC